jgi:hypothetical protein
MLIDFLDRYAVEWSKTNKHSRTGWTQCVPCPRCHNSNFHLGIKDDLTRASCYSCGSWNVGKVLRELTKAPWSEIQLLIGNRAYTPKAEDQQLGFYTPPTQLIEINESPATLAYVLQRGFDPNYLSQIWDCKATGPFSNYPFRLFIPISKGRKKVSWTARAVAGQEPRYQTANASEKEFDEKKLLFGNQFIRDKAIVVEGPLDAIRVGRGAVATLGISYSQQQVNLLADIWRRVIVFDNSEKAQKRARQLADQLAVFPGETYVVNLDADDPGSASRAEIQRLRKFAFGS